MNKNKRDEIIGVIQENLYTLDYRYMFLKLKFPDILPYIDISGSPYTASSEIYYEFEKRYMIDKLINALNTHFNSNIKND